MTPLLNSLARRLKFHVERMVQRGALYQLLIMSCLIAAVAVAGGIAAWAFTNHFDNPFVAIWWAFLRLTDPGYLGDDEGAVLRTISTIVTVLGYVLFMGSLIAIMTQWLARTIRGLESGLTPIVMKNHIVILGWTNRTSETIARLLRARGRLQRFLASRDISSLRVVVLADEVDAVRRLELREFLGQDWSEGQVFLRSGSSLQPTHLQRTDLARASVVLVPGADFAHGGAELNDTRVVKTLLTINAMLESVPADRRPHLVAELFDPLRVPLVRSSVDGPVELIASDQIISRLIYQSVCQHTALPVLLGLFAHRQGNSIYIRGFPQLAGQSSGALIDTFPSAVVLGVLRKTVEGTQIHLDPTRSLTLEHDDMLILLSESFDSCQPAPVPAGAVDSTEPAAPIEPLPPARSSVRRILILGWSHRLGPLLTELDSEDGRHYDVTVMSQIAIEERERALAHRTNPDRLPVRHILGDYASERTMRAVNPERFDSIVFLASGWMESLEQADARTIIGYLLLQSLIADAVKPPECLVELLDPNNGPLLASDRNAILLSPRVLSHVLAHVALRPELNAVLDALLGAGGTELGSRSATELGLAGRTLTFPEIQRAGRKFGCVVVGVKAADDSTVHVNPNRNQRWELHPDDQVMVLELCPVGSQSPADGASPRPD